MEGDDFEFDVDLVEEYLEDDEITAREAGFMRGYNDFVKRKARKAAARNSWLRSRLMEADQNG